MCKLGGVFTKFRIALFIILVALAVIAISDSILHITENEVAELDFSYPCNNSRITLQYGNRAPCYSSANPSFKALPPNQNLTNNNDSKNDECSLHLTINPVSRSNAGTYILTAYNEDGQYIYDARVGLRVDYPPGKASCESSDVYIEGEWISLFCTAPLGNLPGQIVCYQNGMRLPPLTLPNESGGILNQKILARASSTAPMYHVYCCSSISQTIKDRCDCKDCGWDPILNIAIQKITDPCLRVPYTTPLSTSSSHPSYFENNKTTLPSTTVAQTGFNKNATHGYLVALVCVVTIILILTGVTSIFSGVHYFRLRRLEYRYTFLDKCDKGDELRLRSSRSDTIYSEPTEIIDERTEM